MPLQVNRVYELLVTQVTCDHALSAVQQHVRLQVVPSSERRVALFTLVIFLVSVSGHVALQVGTLDKCAVTLLTLVSLVPWKQDTGRGVT